MCLMMTRHEPTKTKLINLPIKINDQPGKMLIYINTLANDEGEPALMIVPIPQSAIYGLVDVSTQVMKNFRTYIESICRNDKTKDTRKKCGALSSNVVPIRKIGNYHISVAENLDILKNNIDWDFFKKPNDWNIRMSTLEDKKLYPFPCAYVVAKAELSISNDGFGIAYLDPGFDYFPTAHEKRQGTNKVDYSVKIYNVSNLNLDKVKFDNGRSKFGGKKRIMHLSCDTAPIPGSCRNIDLPTSCINALTAEQIELKKVLCSLVNYKEISDTFPNQNIIISSNA